MDELYALLDADEVREPASDEADLIAALRSLARPTCAQCGRPWAEWACGPTHALARRALGIELQGGALEAVDAPPQAAAGGEEGK